MISGSKGHAFHACMKCMTFGISGADCPVQAHHRSGTQCPFGSLSQEIDKYKHTLTGKHQKDHDIAQISKIF